MSKKIDVTIVGGGMITNDLLLPAIYHLQRTGIVGEIGICALNNPPLKALAQNNELLDAFPEQSFKAYPGLDEDPNKSDPDLYKSVLSKMKPRQVVVVAMPDHLHYEVVLEALECNQNVLCVKPLVLKYEQSVEIEKIAYDKGLFIGVEYHKRFDRRSLIAKRDYQLGKFGTFVMGEAKLIEPYFYRHSNFQNWFTCELTDPFTYVGCHYVDLVWFITGIRPVEVSVQGVKRDFPNGNTAYMWANGRVLYENGAILSVSAGLGYPDEASGSNEQCLTMFFEGENVGGFLKHDDQFRGVTHSYVGPWGMGSKHHNYINPDFFKLVPWEGKGYKPSGYGPNSVFATINSVYNMENEVSTLDEQQAMARRKEFIKAVDEKGIIATPANSSINELVVEATRLSITNNAQAARIVYGDRSVVELGHASL